MAAIISKGEQPKSFSFENIDEELSCYNCQNLMVTRLTGVNRYLVSCKKYALIFDYRNNLLELEKTTCNDCLANLLD